MGGARRHPGMRSAGVSSDRPVRLYRHFLQVKVPCPYVSPYLCNPSANASSVVRSFSPLPKIRSPHLGKRTKANKAGYQARVLQPLCVVLKRLPSVPVTGAERSTAFSCRKSWLHHWRAIRRKISAFARGFCSGGPGRSARLLGWVLPGREREKRRDVMRLSASDVTVMTQAQTAPRRVSSGREQRELKREDRARGSVGAGRARMPGARRGNGQEEHRHNMNLGTSSSEILQPVPEYRETVSVHTNTKHYRTMSAQLEPRRARVQRRYKLQALPHKSLTELQQEPGSGQHKSIDENNIRRVQGNVVKTTAQVVVSRNVASQEGTHPSVSGVCGGRPTGYHLRYGTAWQDELMAV
ncbi:hypothetical protein Bbelb_096330 [Branchiostoma belcheri]|nr:hypothetical protein Bbelb_096330 [Branchiostoma belcheri]